MIERLTFNPNAIVPAGTKVVTRGEVRVAGEDAPRPRGVVAIILSAPADNTHSYRVRFADGAEASLRRTEFSILRHLQRGDIGARAAGAEAGTGGATGDDFSDARGAAPLDEFSLMQHVIFRCIVGSRAYGLETGDSDVDRRGVYLPPAEMHWSLFGVPDQIEYEPSRHPPSSEGGDVAGYCYWEIQKFLTLALKANPNVLECLYSPLVEHASPLAEEMLAIREAFLSRLIYQTYNGYVLSQFRKLGAELRNRGKIKWKHAMHLIRLLLAGVTALREGVVPVRVEAHRERLLAIRRGETAWEEVDAWRLALHKEFDAAYAATKLPERPDYARVDAFLIKVRKSVVG